MAFKIPRQRQPMGLFWLLVQGPFKEVSEAGAAPLGLLYYVHVESTAREGFCFK